MNRLQKHCSTLKLLHQAKPSLRKAILERGPDDLIRTICDCAIVNRKISLKKKRSVIQKGGFLGALLGAVIPAIASLVDGLTSRR